MGLDYKNLAARTEGYSGSDIVLVCKEAAMRPVRRLMNKLVALGTLLITIVPSCLVARCPLAVPFDLNQFSFKTCLDAKGDFPDELGGGTLALLLCCDPWRAVPCLNHFRCYA